MVFNWVQGCQEVYRSRQLSSQNKWPAKGTELTLKAQEIIFIFKCSEYHFQHTPSYFLSKLTENSKGIVNYVFYWGQALNFLFVKPFWDPFSLCTWSTCDIKIAQKFALYQTNPCYYSFQKMAPIPGKFY